MSVLAIAAIVIVSCNKKFDEPPVYVPPAITPDLTIADLIAMHTAGGLEQITDDKTIGGTVVADDSSGNYYKTIVLQDETGGIEVKLDGYDLYANYPVGRKVYIKVKDLYLGDYNGLPEIGGGIDNSVTPARLAYIPSTLFDQYLIKGETGVTPPLKVIGSVSDLTDADLNTLIQLNDFQFSTSDTSKTYADPTLASSAVNFTIKNCANESITLRNSSYANFAAYKVPGGKGSIVAIYNKYGSTKQLKIRDTGDVKFYGDRCGSGPVTDMSIADVRALFTSGQTSVPDGRKITGIVISDKNGNNINSQNIVLQEGDNLSGIVVRFEAAHSFNAGDKVEVNISGMDLSEYNGWLQISYLPLANATKMGTGTITPRVTTAQDLLNNFEAWESTLITLNNVTIAGGTTGTWKGSTTINDGTGSVVSFTSSVATFANDAYPTGTVSTFTGYVSQFNTDKQVTLRNTSDVGEGSGGGGGGGGGGTTGSDLILSEYVEGSSNNKYLEIYNAGTTDADLSKYVVKLYANGTTTPTNSAKLDTLTGISTLAPGGIIVLKNSSAILTLPGGVTAYSSSVCNFNGDDAITIEKDGTVIDVFGTVGTDPGTSWTISGSSTGAQDKTVRRKATVTEGNTDWSVSSANEWDVITTIDDVSNLGTR